MVDLSILIKQNDRVKINTLKVTFLSRLTIYFQVWKPIGWKDEVEN